MNELLAFLLPPATALAGMRLARWILGEGFNVQFGFGFRFAFGLAVGMLLFSQAVLLSALAGFNGSIILGRLALIWGAVELLWLAKNAPSSLKNFHFRPGYLWLVLLLPLVYSWWVFGRLSTLEGTLEYDANAFWVFKAKILFLEQGRNLVAVLQQPNLAYLHSDYPWLVPGIYTLGYGTVGMVDEFVNKVWPFWMMVALCLAVLSIARMWQKPGPLPVAIVTIIGFLPASLEFIRNEGGTIPMFFCVNIAALLLVRAIYHKYEAAAPAILLAFAVCFSTKLEGAAYAGFCFCALAPFCLRYGWWKNKVLWKSSVAAVISLLPYVFYRLAKPVWSPESGWLHDGLAQPYAALQCAPKIWFLTVISHFFSPVFFNWEADGNHLRWTGHWTGGSSFINDQLSILPWLILVLLIISIIYKARGRIMLGVLTAVVIATWTFLSIVPGCLAEMHNHLDHSISWSFGAGVRIFDPFFIAWFLGIAALWFPERTGDPPVPQPRPKKTLR